MLNEISRNKSCNGFCRLVSQPSVKGLSSCLQMLSLHPYKQAGMLIKKLNKCYKFRAALSSVVGFFKVVFIGN